MGLTIGSLLERVARVSPSATAATLSEEKLTFGELDTASNRVAHALAGHGLRLGDRVAWWSDTSLEALPVFGGLAKLGAVFMPVNARLSVAEAAPVVEYASPRLLLTGASHRDAGHELAAVLSLDHLDAPALARRVATAAADRFGGPQPDETDAHVIFFTSGSTGQPKGVVLSHRVNWLRSYPGATVDAATGGGVVCMFPLFHMAGFTLALGAWQGRRAIHFAAADPAALLDAAVRHRAGRMYCIPAVWARILDHGVARHDLSTLHDADTGTSATPPELLAAIKEALPHTSTRVFYGSTEAGSAALLGDRDLARKPGSVGLPPAGVEVELRDGEICVRSDMLFDGYFANDEATRAALTDDGWYRTGDLGALDGEGYLSVVGRARDVIRSGGETVAPVEVEAALLSHDGVGEVAVVGVPDPTWGEIVTAVVVVPPGADAPTVDDLRAHCAGHLAGFKQPRRVVIVDALPRTPATGQVQRTLIVERLIAGA
jgi:acyl-CoA synthetase (AMP-forming)/AMP-acid ligase II